MYDFDNDGIVIFNGRNTIKAFNVDGHEVVVKRFQRPNYVKKIIYTFFRKSKAYRSYFNAKELVKRGISTPAPIEYIETKRFGLLDYCYYVCERNDDPPIEDLIDRDDWNHELAAALAVFAAKLHQKGVLHKDFNDTNIRYDKDFNFSLIDLNRMAIYPEGAEIPLNICLDNLTRFTGRIDLFEYVAREYAACRGLDVDATAKLALSIKNRHDKAWRIRKRICHPMRYLRSVMSGK
ncbi:MAG: lipopolysaccharide kinase InaA family protein [Prevotellaceae bacterium]|nr:lipopolysaccharide kinase InaA family protein [Prevotellaceae bacterium]